jgi:hypothetical protein
MNRYYIHNELIRRNIPHEFVWTDAGFAVKLIACIYKEGGGSSWLSLIPIGDDEDKAFVDAVESWRKKHPVITRG